MYYPICADTCISVESARFRILSIDIRMSVYYNILLYT